MDWSSATWWWIFTGVLVAAELATGTFYLLMLALGTGAAALAAHGGASLGGQFLAASVFAAGAVLLWYRRRRGGTPAGSDRNVNLDIGERVRVERWEADGSSRVHYRGAAWDARYAGHGTPQPGDHRIRSIDGSRLLLEPSS